MSEKSYRRGLLGQASVVALAAAALLPKNAQAQDDGQLKIELGGGLAGFQGGDSTFLPPQLLGLDPALDRTIAPDDGSSFLGAVTFQPAGSPNIFNLGVKYGKSDTRAEGRDFAKSGAFFYYGPIGPATTGIGYVQTSYNLDVTAEHKAEHAIIDFEVGRDFGIGGNSSVVSLGLRYANLKADTDIAYSGAQTSGFLVTQKYFAPASEGGEGTYVSTYKYYGPNVSEFAGSGQIRRKFQGIGPRISWRGQHNFGDSGFFLGWTAGANVLYGKREARGVASNATLGLDFDREDNVWSPGYDASVAVGFGRGPLALKVGYQVDAQYDAIDTGFEKESGSEYVTHGPFATLVWTLR